MATRQTIIPPRRDLLLAQTGIASPRYIQYFEDLSRGIEVTSEELEVDEEQIQENTDNIATNTAAIASNSSAISTNSTNIATNTANIATNTADIAENDRRIGFHTVINSNYTTTGVERIICNGALTVSLDSTPLNDDRVYIKSLTNPITIDGNGKTIDGETSFTVDVPYTCLLVVYSVDLDAWFIL